MNYDPPMYVANYAQTRQLPFKVALDDGSVAKQFGNVHADDLRRRQGRQDPEALRRRTAVRGTRRAAQKALDGNAA